MAHNKKLKSINKYEKNENKRNVKRQYIYIYIYMYIYIYRNIHTYIPYVTPHAYLHVRRLLYQKQQL